MRFVVVSDGHYNQDAAFPPLHDDALARIDEIHNERSIDFVVHNGDIVHDDETEHQTVIDNFFSKLPTGVPWYPVFGNHDWATDAEWQDFYGQPKQHTFEPHPDYGCIITNTGTDRSAGFQSADSTFVKNQIDAFEADGKQGVFVFQHIAPFTDTDVVGVDSPDVREQFDRDIVKGVFLGHNHEKGWTEVRGGTRYHYVCRIGGEDGTGVTNRPILSKGLRVFDVNK